MIEHMPKNFAIKSGAEKFPLMVVVSFSYVCNAKCPNCPYNNSTIRNTYKDAMLISQDIFYRIAEECGKHNAFIRLSGGGEPMLHPKAAEFIVYAKTVGAKVGLITNGSKFTNENIEKLIDCNIDVIEFSADAGDKKTYNIVRPGLSWEKLLTNVEYAAAYRNKKKATTKIIVSIINQKDVNVDDAEQFWKTKVDAVQIRKYLTWGYNKDNSADATPYLDMGKRIPCPWLFERLNIDSRGDVTICGEDLAFNYKFTNIMERTIQDVWLGKEFEYFRKMHLLRSGDDIEICKTCPDWQFRSWEHNYWKLIGDKK